MDNFMCDDILNQINEYVCSSENTENNNESLNTPSNPINFQIGLFAPVVKEYVGIVSQVILDSWWKYYLQYRATRLDGVSAPSLFNNCGYTEIVSSLYDNREISLVMYDKPDQSYYFETRNPEKENEDLACCDTPVGFKLSQILRNVGDLNQVAMDSGKAAQLDPSFGQTPVQILNFTQTGYISDDKDDRRLIFKFQITNISKIFVARRVLFKDIFAKGVSLIPGEVYINGKKVEDFKVCYEGRRLFVRLPVINPGVTVTLVVVCHLHKNKEGLTNYRIMNFGALCSVYSHYISQSFGSEIVRVGVQISNIVYLRNIM